MSSGDGNGVEEPPRALLACQACGKAGPPKTCSGCKAVFYCDRDCQIRDRMDHRTMCAGLKKCRLQQEQEIEKAKKLLQDKQEHAVTECAICLEENASSEASFVKLHCGHFFCYVCLLRMSGPKPGEARSRLLSFVSPNLASLERSPR